MFGRTANVLFIRVVQSLPKKKKQFSASLTSETMTQELRFFHQSLKNSHSGFYIITKSKTMVFLKNVSYDVLEEIQTLDSMFLSIQDSVCSLEFPILQQYRGGNWQPARNSHRGYVWSGKWKKNV